jgi:hypothetical protein
MSGQTDQPSVITLDETNSVQIMSQYIELAQQKGAYLLNEAELLKRASDVLVNNVPDHEINKDTAKQVLIQGVHKGQKSGAYTLNDAALLSKVVNFVIGGLPTAQAVPATQAVQETAPQDAAQSIDDDLSELADPIPLRPKEV